MNEKDYLEKVHEIKENILLDISMTIGWGRCHYFLNTFYIHYVNDEEVVTVIAEAVSIDANGEVGMWIRKDNNEQYIQGSELRSYDVESLIGILTNVRSELLHRTLKKTYESISFNGGNIEINGQPCDNDYVFIRCYTKTSRMKRKNAIKKYYEGMCACDGSESSRYAYIFSRLCEGAKFVNADIM